MSNEPDCADSSNTAMVTTRGVEDRNSCATTTVISAAAAPTTTAANSVKTSKLEAKYVYSATNVI